MCEASPINNFNVFQYLLREQSSWRWAKSISVSASWEFGINRYSQQKRTTLTIKSSNQALNFSLFRRNYLASRVSRIPIPNLSIMQVKSLITCQLNCIDRKICVKSHFTNVRTGSTAFVNFHYIQIDGFHVSNATAVHHSLFIYIYIYVNRNEKRLRTRRSPTC